MEIVILSALVARTAAALSDGVKMTTLLQVQNVSKSFGGLRVIRDCDLQVQEGSITGLIGPNGAGKSTLFNLIAGTSGIDEGAIYFRGEDVTALPAHDLFSRGLLRTFQIAHEFSNLSVFENLMMVPGGQAGESLFNACFQRSQVLDEERALRQKAQDVIDFLVLGPVKNELAGNLSGGQKKLLELGRTMMVDAKMVLLDEVAAGVNRSLLQHLATNIERLQRELGYTFFVIEHDMDLIARLCDPVIVLSEGQVMMEGSMVAVRNNPAVVNAYFGGGSTIAAELV